jgi:hypothetical protein
MQFEDNLKEDEKDGTNTPEEVEEQDRRPSLSGMREIKDQDSEGMKHQEDPLLTGMKIFFLVIVILVEILDTKQSIAESMKGKTMQET